MLMTSSFILLHAMASSSSSSSLSSSLQQQEQNEQERIHKVILAMNDSTNYTFLKELVSQKSVTDVSYHTTTAMENTNINHTTMSTLPSSTQPPQPSTSSTIATMCEYTGHLWFLPKSKGIKFREIVKIVSPPLTIPSLEQQQQQQQRQCKDDLYNAIECQTSYHDGTKWIDCSKVTCQISSTGSAAETMVDHGETVESSSSSLSLFPKLNIMVETEMLMNLPLPSFAVKGIRRKISSVFQNAVESFLEKHHY